MSTHPRLVLVGGGHAHVEVLRQLAETPIPRLETTLVSERAHAIYSGMVPGFVAGQYTAREIAVDLAALAGRAGARLLEQRVVRIDPEIRRIGTDAGETLDYTLASLDVGSTVAGLGTPGVREHALASRPIADLVEQVEELPAAGRVAVVGGGAAGFELACCVRERMAATTGIPPHTTLVEADDRILPGASGLLRRVAERAARARGIRIRAGARVRAVREDGLELTDGERIEAERVLWVTGAAPHPFLRDAPLPHDDAGFLPVTPSLLVEGRHDLFAVGDCASLPGTRKAGVYAVRQGPVLAANLRAHVEGTPLRDYTPQHDFLALLNLGDGRAIAAKWGLAAHGRWAMRLKDRIDRGWMARYA
jgi:pyridine nucleotide-disulfide oxidoreductase family protein